MERTEWVQVESTDFHEALNRIGKDRVFKTTAVHTPSQHNSAHKHLYSHFYKDEYSDKTYFAYSVVTGSRALYYIKPEEVILNLITPIEEEK